MPEETRKVVREFDELLNCLAVLKRGLEQATFAFEQMIEVMGEHSRRAQEHDAKMIREAPDAGVMAPRKADPRVVPTAPPPQVPDDQWQPDSGPSFNPPAQMSRTVPPSPPTPPTFGK